MRRSSTTRGFTFRVPGGPSKISRSPLRGKKDISPLGEARRTREDASAGKSERRNEDGRLQGKACRQGSPTKGGPAGVAVPGKRRKKINPAIRKSFGGDYHLTKGGGHYHERPKETLSQPPIGSRPVDREPFFRKDSLSPGKKGGTPFSVK